MTDNLVLVFEPSAPPLAALVPALADFDRLDLQEGTGWDQIVVYDGDRHVFVQPYPPAEMAAEHYFDDWPPDLLPARASGLVITVGDVDLAKRVALALARLFRFWVDTTFGEIYESDEFVQKCAQEPGWDWRRWPSERTTVALAHAARTSDP